MKVNLNFVNWSITYKKNELFTRKEKNALQYYAIYIFLITNLFMYSDNYTLIYLISSNVTL